MTPVRLQDLPSLRPPSPYLAAEIAAQVRQPVGVLHSDALVPKEWSVCMVRERWFIHAPRGAGHQLENEHLRLQVLPPIGTSSGRGRVHNRPQAGDGGPGNEPFTLTCFSIGAAVSLVVGPRPRPPGPTLQSRRSESWNSIHHSPPAARTRQSGRPRSKSTRPSRPATSMVASSTRSGPSQPPHSSTSRCGLSASASSGSRSKEGNT